MGNKHRHHHKDKHHRRRDREDDQKSRKHHRIPNTPAPEVNRHRLHQNLTLSRPRGLEPPKPKSMEHKVIITGTGRAGTTFLVALLTELGVKTCYKKGDWLELI